LMSGSTPLAQGGIAAVFSETDNFKKHIEDTMKAGAYHNNKKIVEYVVKKAPSAIKKLIQFGVEFDKENSHLSLGLEGGHSPLRILRVHRRLRC
ncbi:MAG: FAD-binding protein, partial [Elusimicrobiota bacterium]